MTVELEEGGVSGQQHAPAALYPRERPGTHFTGGWVGPRAGLDGRKISSPPGLDPGPSSPQSVAIPTELPGPHLLNKEVEIKPVSRFVNNLHYRLQLSFLCHTQHHSWPSDLPHFITISPCHFFQQYQLSDQHSGRCTI